MNYFAFVSDVKFWNAMTKLSFKKFVFAVVFVPDRYASPFSDYQETP